MLMVLALTVVVLIIVIYMAGITTEHSDDRYEIIMNAAETVRKEGGGYAKFTKLIENPNFNALKFAAIIAHARADRLTRKKLLEVLNGEYQE